MKIPTIYLSRRNLLTLLSKLDRNTRYADSNDISTCCITKNDNKHPVYPQSMKSINVYAIEDEVYYTDRLPGVVHPKDLPTKRS